MKKINQTFLQGLIVVMPVTLTFYLLYWASVKVEGMFGSVVKWAVGQDLYIPGAGILLTLVVVFSVGLLARNYVTGRLFRWFTRKMEQFPLIKVIYNPLKDIMALLPGRGGEPTQQRVVLVEHGGAKVMGLVTREGLAEIGRADLITVYVPYSYMLGGLTLIVPADKVEKVDLAVDQAIKLSVTAWIKAKDETPSAP